MSNPLSLRISDNETRNARIETDVINPIAIDDTFATGGYCRFILKHRGMLHPDSRIILPATTQGTDFQYSPTGGVFSLISRAVLRIGGKVISDVDQANLLMAHMNMLRPMEHREKIDAALHGVNSSWESCSGARNQRSEADGTLITNNENREILAGQFRIKSTKDYVDGNMLDSLNNEFTAVKGLKFKKAQLHPAYTLRTSEDETPQFMISLQQLFPGFMSYNLELPLALINPNDQVEIELFFTNNGDWGNNERAILAKDCTQDGGGAYNGFTIAQITGLGASDASQRYNVGDILTSVALSGGKSVKDAPLFEVVATTNGALEGGLLATSLRIIDGGSNLPDATSADMQLVNVKVKNNLATGAHIDYACARLDAGWFNNTNQDNWTLARYGQVNRPIRVAVNKVVMLADYVYYMDGTEQAKRQQMNSASGLQMPYTVYRNVQTTLPKPSDALQPAVGNSQKVKFSRQVGLANEVVRQMTWQLNSTGNFEGINTSGQAGECEVADVNVGYTAMNRLLLDYCSVGSDVQAGTSYQLLVNSIPYFPAPISHSQDQYIKHSECFEAPLYVPEGCFNSWTSCKQQDDQLTASASSQPGFTTDYSIETATRRYQHNNRKSGVANQLYLGHSQQEASGMMNYQGVSFKLQKGVNVSGNGVKIGNLPVVIELEREFTNSEYHNKDLKLTCFAECERMFSLRNGFVQVSGASY